MNQLFLVWIHTGIVEVWIKQLFYYGMAALDRVTQQSFHIRRLIDGFHQMFLSRH